MNKYKEKEKIRNEIKSIEVRGLIYDIQRYSVHDGPGIRTIVFLKGCYLHCPWCANPESQCRDIELMGDEMVGKEVTVEEVIKVVERDIHFYNGSGGGMTLSGGEPLLQPEFSEALVIEAKKKGINVAIETSGYQNWELLWKVIRNIDIVLLDMKIMSSEDHKAIVGVNNNVILNNAKKMAEMDKKIIVRVPIIPNYTDSLSNLNKIAEFSKEIGVNELHFLPYHRLGVHKYVKLNREYELHGATPIGKDNLKNIARIIQEQFGVKIIVY